MSEAFDPPLEVTFKGDDQPKVFRTHKSLMTWATRELDVWNEFFDSIIPLGGQYVAAITAQTVYLKAIIITLNDVALYNSNPDEFDGRIKSSLGKHVSKKCVRSDASEGQYVRELVETDPAMALMALSYWNPNVFSIADTLRTVHSRDNDVPVLNAWVKGIAAAQIFDQGIRGNARSQKSTLNKLRQEWDVTLDEYRAVKEEIDTSLESKRDDFNKLYDKQSDFVVRFPRRARRSLKRVKTRYENELALQIPVTYWTKKAESHRAQAIFWGVTFAVIITVTLMTFLYFFPSVALTLSSQEGSPSVGPNVSTLLLLGVPAFLVIWMIRLVSRQLNTNVSQWHDARERAVMTQTFLALISEGHATEQDRILILHALFRPSAASPSDDGAPPYWFDLLTERMKPKS